jgi:nicotinamidase-related amidase
MKVRTLVIDAQRVTCDPSLVVINPSHRHYYDHIDETAGRIHEFVEATRDDSEPIWAIQLEELTKSFRRTLTPEEAAFHRVQPRDQEPRLVKTRWSAVEEHPEFFEEQKRLGVGGYILVGFWADKCLPKNAEHLLAKGNKVIIPTDLSCTMDTGFDPEPYLDLMHEEGLILTERKHVMDMLREPVHERRKPRATISQMDIWNMCYGFGG